MVNVFIRHAVRDYAAWKKVFDALAPHRRAGGELRYKVSRMVGDPDMVCLSFQWESVASAGEFFASPELADAWKRAGVLERPEVLIAEETESGET